MVRAIMAESLPGRRPTGSSHRRRALVAAGVVGVGALTAASVSMFDSSPNAFAGWRSVPSVITGPTADRLVASCKENLLQGESGLSKSMQMPGAGRDRQAIVERRGIYTMTVIFSPGANDYSCLRGRAGEFLGGGGQSIPRTGPAAHQAIEFGGAGSDDGKGHRYWVDAGRYGPGVRGVEVILRDGASITAAVHNGFWSAWWPSWERPHTLVLRLSNGKLIHQPTYR